jgi:fatty acid amide hydrolase 2
MHFACDFLEKQKHFLRRKDDFEHDLDTGAVVECALWRVPFGRCGTHRSAVFQILTHSAWQANHHDPVRRHPFPLAPKFIPLISASVDKRLLKSGLALSADVAARRVTSAQLTDLAIARATAINADINAIVATRYDAARQEAAAADRNQGSADQKFRGVPCTIKEAIGVTGMPNASGFVPRKDFRVAKDATVVKRLRAHGIVVIGVTNTSELCMWQESYNKLYGTTNNPHDTARTVGGSSGGEAAVVAAGVSPIGVGSDIGGSIRMPAFFCGVFGHKPTGGAVPNTGQFPIARNEALRYLTTGPITRHAEDLFPMLQIMAGPDGEDAFCRPIHFGAPDKLDIAS